MMIEAMQRDALSVSLRKSVCSCDEIFAMPGVSCTHEIAKTSKEKARLTVWLFRSWQRYFYLLLKASSNAIASSLMRTFKKNKTVTATVKAMPMIVEVCIGKPKPIFALARKVVMMVVIKMAGTVHIQWNLPWRTR